MWDRTTKRLRCDFQHYVQPPGTTSPEDGHYLQCPATVEALTAEQARRAARLVGWQKGPVGDRCNAHVGATRQKLRREDYFPRTQRR